MFLNILFLLTNLAIASGESVDFTTVKKGEEVPFDGKLLTNEALAQIISTHELELEALRLEKENELNQKVIDMSLEHNIYKIECEATKEIQELMIEKRDEELKIQARKDLIQRTAFVAGFSLGTAITIAITHSVNQN